MAKNKEKQPEVLTEVIVRFYRPDNDLVITHKPEVIFSGEVLSMKRCETIDFHIRKALRRYKIELNNAIVNESEVSDD
jgi:hypothetical protein